MQRATESFYHMLQCRHHRRRSRLSGLRQNRRDIRCRIRLSRHVGSFCGNLDFLLRQLFDAPFRTGRRASGTESGHGAGLSTPVPYRLVFDLVRLRGACPLGMALFPAAPVCHGAAPAGTRRRQTVSLSSTGVGAVGIRKPAGSDRGTYPWRIASTSPSCTIYSLPSSRRSPLPRAAAYPPCSISFSQWMASARMNFFAKSL